MKSRHVDEFNHDADAPTYDADVADESHPVRAGYRALLEWVAQRAAIDSMTDVLDLGAGTGNLTARLLGARHVTAVDASARMLEIARAKHAAPNLRCVVADLLDFFPQPGRYDCIVSTYAVHHLEDDEKMALFGAVREALRPSGRAVFGDLMFEDAAARRRSLTAFRARGATDVVDAIETEYFWHLDIAVPALEALGFAVETRQFSELSWGLVCLPRAIFAPSGASTARS